MVNSIVEKCSTSSLIGETQIKTEWDLFSICLIGKAAEVWQYSVGENVVQQELPYPASGL